MGALDGTLNTPFGAVKKKTALVGGGVVAAIIGIGWYRNRQAQSAATSSAAIEENGINPATGYVYNSPEDLAALAEQAASGGGGGSGGGSGAMPDVTIGYATNGQWVQGTIAYMTGASIVTDPALISEALGKYISGQWMRTDQVSLVEQAIAISGYPPVAGPNGFPPSINTTPPATPPPTTPPPTTPPPTTPPPTTPPTLPARRYGLVHKYTNGSDQFSYLSGIARAFGRSTAELQQWNGISNPNLVFTNQKIWVDPPGNYSGETKVF